LLPEERHQAATAEGGVYLGRGEVVATDAAYAAIARSS
jgi:hypothetical protein